jgi:hypothetical protein
VAAAHAAMTATGASTRPFCFIRLPFLSAGFAQRSHAVAS